MINRKYGKHMKEFILKILKRREIIYKNELKTSNY
jgi:hypothetical protein